MRKFRKVKINKEILRDKIHAAWIGKNIGGTFGGPYEGTTDFLDVKDFVTEAGVPLPNDDLDLQLIWLYALEREGPWNFSARVLSEYWLSAIVPHWAEYGYAKANLRAGIPPMLSGELHNPKYRDSNGAWIRSEIWACLAPGFPGIARKFAFIDAQIDHGLGEGTYAELFTATLESAAFFESDLRKIVEAALNAIPKDTDIVKIASYVISEYDKGTPYRLVRDGIVEMTKHYGTFMAAANIGYVIIGLLYGEGDFKKSMIYATNCGDDTDCTAATVGAVLGILNGNAGIPEDWKCHIGDEIVTICIGTTHQSLIPKSCKELTERVLRMMPSLLLSEGVELEFTDGETDIGDALEGASTDELYNRSRYSFDLVRNGYMTAVAEYDTQPIVKAGDSVKIGIKLTNITPEACSFSVKMILPEGFDADYPRSFVMGDWWRDHGKRWEATVTVGDKLEAINHVYVIMTPNEHTQPIIADFVFEA